jgi:hypothetical protein
MLKADPRDTPVCPRCRVGVGLPICVKSDCVIITVTFKCLPCGHVWPDKRDDPLVFRNNKGVA